MTESSRPFTVYLVDDHEVVRRGLKVLFDSDPVIDVVGEAATASEAIMGIRKLRPDVAILDLRLPDSDGVSLCREIREEIPATRCLILTSYAEDEALFGAIMAGASGYLLKEIGGTDLIGHVKTIASGGTLLDAAEAERIMARVRPEVTEPDPLAALSLQDRRLLECIGEGLTNRQIGVRMNLTEKTVKNYVSMLLSKLGVEHRTQAAILATRVNLAGRRAGQSSGIAEP